MIKARTLGQNSILSIPKFAVYLAREPQVVGGPSGGRRSRCAAARRQLRQGAGSSSGNKAAGSKMAGSKTAGSKMAGNKKTGSKKTGSKKTERGSRGQSSR